MQTYDALHLPTSRLGLELLPLKVNALGRWFWNWRSKCLCTKGEGNRDSEPVSLQFRFKRVNPGQTENWIFFFFWLFENSKR